MRKLKILGCLLFSVLTVTADAQECANTLTEAEGLYEIGRFNETIGKLKNCLDKKAFTYTEKIQAYRLLSMSYLAVDSAAQADENIEKLLMMKDNFEADVRDPDRFRLQVLYIRQLLRANLISSVSKKAENIDLAPATIVIITEKDIINRGYRDLESVFYDLPAFDINKTSGLSYSVLYQRGYRSASNTERTLLLVDGVQDNELWSNAAFITKQYSLSNIKRVEVIYGPASTIYGANAFVGVINIVTKGSEDYFKHKAGNAESKKLDIALTGQTGMGSLNTKYGDFTVAGKHRELFFSITGRAYQSDEVDLSKFPDWDGKWTADEFGPNRYQNSFTLNYTKALDSTLKIYDPTNSLYNISADQTKILPTALAIHLADSLDQANYAKGYNGVKSNFSDPSKEYYLAAKMRFGDFTAGLEYFNWNEGVAPDYVDRYYIMNHELQNWQGRHGYMYVRYDKNLSERVSFSNQTSFRINDFGKQSVVTRFFGYANGGLNFVDFVKGKQPYYLPNFFGVQCKQFRTESRVMYVINEKLDLNGGIELRNGFFQGDYINSVLPDPLVTGVIRDSIKGGNFYSVFDIGAYAQVSYVNKARKFNVNIGGRMDNNSINGSFGYGTVFNPRFALIYYPGKWIFKGIYSQAFLDASVYNKFATSSARLVNNPTLDPERVANIEISARYNLSKKTHAEIAYYNSYYTNILGTVNIDTMGVRTTQYRAIGKARIQGLQLSAEHEVNKWITVYANAYWTNPLNILTSRIDGKDSTVRLGDISRFSFNAGVNASLLKERLNINVRLNYVGDKPTGKTTSVSGNPYDVIDGRTLLNAAITGYLVEGIGVQLCVDNIFDTFYYSPGVRGASGVQSSRVPQAGRFFTFKIITQLTTK